MHDFIRGYMMRFYNVGQIQFPDMHKKSWRGTDHFCFIVMTGKKLYTCMEIDFLWFMTLQSTSVEIKCYKSRLDVAYNITNSFYGVLVWCGAASSFIKRVIWPAFHLVVCVDTCLCQSHSPCFVLRNNCGLRTPLIHVKFCKHLELHFLYP